MHGRGSACRVPLGFSMISKKGAVSLWEDWVEILAFLLLVAGFLISTLVTSALISYLIVFCGGLMGGRLLFRYKHHLKFTWILVLVGFIVGFAIGAAYGDTKIIILLFIVGNAIGYYLHDQGYISTTEY